MLAVLVCVTLSAGIEPDSVRQMPKETGIDVAPVIDAKQVAKVRGKVLAYLRESNGRTVQAPPAPSGNADVWCIQRYDVAKSDKKKLLRLIAEDLALCGVFASGDSAEQSQSVCIAIEASRCALTRLGDKNLSPSIIDAYVLPLFAQLPADSTTAGNQCDVLQTAGQLYFSSGRTDQSLAAYRMLREQAPNRNMSDFAAFKVAQVLESQQKYADAIRSLAEISDSDGMAGAKALISELRTKLRVQQRQRNCCNVD
jgi:tetratricopeptide (TPR) repeat protein